MAVTAPFDFARVPRGVWFPDWADLVSHDVPLADGWSGTLEVELEAKTPLLVGGERRKATSNKSGEVWPVELGEGRYGIPDSSLQGMIRAVLEIGCFGKLGPWVDKRRFGIRDLSPAARAYFQSRMLSTDKPDRRGPIYVDPLVRTGWLRRYGNEFFFKPCEMARIEIDDIRSFCAQNTNRWQVKSDVDDRYSWLGQAAASQHLAVENAPAPYHRHRRGALEIAYRKAFVEVPRGHQSSISTKSGKIVLTGHTGANPLKHMEFFFFDDGPEIQLTEEFSARFKEFEAIHAPDDGRPPNKNWKFYRDQGYPGQKSFSQGGWMPIFYLEGAAASTSIPDIESFGLAFMFKLAHSNDTLDMLAHSSPDHLDRKQLDLASLIFGAVGEDRENRGRDNGAWVARSLKRRASFDMALADVNTKIIDPEYQKPRSQPDNKFAPLNSDATVLMGPKPSYFQIYVRQPSRAGNRLNTDNRKRPVEPFASYTPTERGVREVTNPELAGAKIWPAPSDMQAGSRWCLPAPPARWGNNPNGSVDSKATHVALHALPSGTTFSTRLRFHNLRTAELGALLWALSFGDADALKGLDSGLRHRIGMGKPYRMGSLRISVLHDKSELRPNVMPADGKAPTLSEFMRAFERQMDDVCAKLAAPQRPFAWRESVQVKALLKAAKADASHERDYMELDQYVAQRNQGYFLAPFTDGKEFGQPEAQNRVRQLPARSDQPRRQGGGGNNQPGQANRVQRGPVSAGMLIRMNGDGREGETLTDERVGCCEVRFEDGTRDNFVRVDTFTVIGTADE